MRLLFSGWKAGMGAIKGSEWVKGKMVGCGSFGTVHLAMNKSTGGLFVVKSTHSGDGREALDNEVKILNTLNSSPYIVQCLGTEEDKLGNLQYVFMEYMGGGSLADVAHKFGGSLDEEVVRLYTREILHGLKHLHQHGIVHCDLKCKNVLLGSSGNVKLADFGCAKRVNLKNYYYYSSWASQKKSSCIIGGGTPLWMAPEVLRNERLDYGADIWSLGCTVIEMATGRPPWADEVSVSLSNSNNNNNHNPMAAVFRIARGDDGMLLPQFPRHFSKEGLDFLMRCLEREPNKRSTVEDLLSHPFVVSTSTTKKESSAAAAAAASSPASVLEVPKFEDDADDELESRSQAGRNDFSIRSRNSSYVRYDDHPQRTTIWQLEDSAALGGGGGGGNWITIR